jgi:hypothetical protein
MTHGQKTIKLTLLSFFKDTTSLAILRWKICPVSHLIFTSANNCKRFFLKFFSTFSTLMQFVRSYPFLHSFAYNICLYFKFIWLCIITNFFVIKPTRCTNFTNLFWHETQHCSDSSSNTWSCSNAVYKPVWHIPLLSAQWINSWW